MQRNLVFIPKGRQFLGKVSLLLSRLSVKMNLHVLIYFFQEIYLLGKLNLYIEQGVCFVSDGAGDWVPTSISKMFEKA